MGGLRRVHTSHSNEGCSVTQHTKAGGAATSRSARSGLDTGDIRAAAAVSVLFDRTGNTVTG